MAASSKGREITGKLNFDDQNTDVGLLRSKDKKTDKQVRNLGDQSHRLNDYNDKAYPTTFSNTAVQDSSLAPSQNRLISGFSRPASTNHRMRLENIPEIVQRQPTSSLTSPSNYAQSSQGQISSRIENEIEDLKNIVLERIRSQDTASKIKGMKKDKKSTFQRMEAASSSETEEEEQQLDLQRAAQIQRKLSTKSLKGETTNSELTSRSGNSSQSAAFQSRNQTKFDEYKLSEPIFTTNAKITNNNIALLKAQYEEREAVLTEKYLNLKIKAKEIRSTLQEYVDKCIDLEENLNRKDQVLLDYEEQIRLAQQDLLKNYDALQEAKRNEDTLIKSEENLRQDKGELLSRIKEYKKRLNHAEEHGISNEEKLSEQIEALQNERQEIKIVLRGREDTIAILTINNEKLKDELDALRKEFDKQEKFALKQEADMEDKNVVIAELRLKLESLQVESKGIHGKIDEYKVNKKLMEDKLERYRRQIEGDRAQWEVEKNKHLEKKKQKIAKLKLEIKELERIITKQRDNKKELAVEIEKVQMNKLIQEKELHRYREELLLVQQEM